MPTPEENRTNMSRRLGAAQRDVTEKRDAYDVSLELRRELITQAVDADGMTTREVSIALGLSQSRILAILGVAA